MSKFIFSELSRERLNSIVKIEDNGFVPARWNQSISECTAREKEKIQLIQEYSLNYQLSLMNEATIWARTIYPLLMLAESRNIQAWAEVPLAGKYPHFEMEGIVEGVLGRCISGVLNTPYLVVVEAKRGLEAKNPQFQVYGEMLVAAWLNQQHQPKTAQQIFGCYTISDTWTFVHSIVSGFEDDYPLMVTEISREYTQKTEAETILQILKSIVSKEQCDD